MPYISVTYISINSYLYTATEWPSISFTWVIVFSHIMSSSNIIAWKMKFFWTSESKRTYSLCFLHLVWTLTSRNIRSLNSALTALSSNASETSKIKISYFLTSSVLKSLYCNDLLCHNFSSSEISLQYFASELYIIIKPLY